MTLGKCLAKSAIFVDTRDELKQMRFFPIPLYDHFDPKSSTTYWYFERLYYKVALGSVDCCSNTIAGMHYITPNEMYSLDYLIYHVHPYGISKNKNDGIPDKLTLNEILERSRDIDSNKSIIENNIVNQMDKSEYF